jgi:hypothetical protein
MHWVIRLFLDWLILYLIDGSNSSVCSSKSSVAYFFREFERGMERRPDVAIALNLGSEYVEQPPLSVDDVDHTSRIYSTSTSSLQALLQQRFAILSCVHGYSVQELQHAKKLWFRHFRPVEHPKKTGGMFRILLDENVTRTGSLDDRNH